MAKFKVGDRVRVVRGYHVMTPRTGWTGTVRYCTGESVVADWDNVGRRKDSEDVCGVDMVELIEPATDFEARIEAIEKRLDELYLKPERPDYKFGDRVEVFYGGRWWPGIIGDRMLDGRLLVMFQPFGSTSILHFEPAFVRPA